MASSSVSLVGARLRETSTTQLFALGTSCFDDLGSRWEYVQANGAITQYDYVKIDDDFQAASGTTTLLPNTEPARVGCAQVAFADNEYGWVVRSGKHTGRFAASCAQDVKIYTTATAGVVDDSATTLINGLKLITTITSATSAPAFAACDMTTVAA
jgi:hypothetical protein